MSNPVQSKLGTWSAPATTCTVTTTSLPTAGNQIICIVRAYTSSPVVSSIADNASGSSTYVRIDGNVDAQAQADLELWWCPSVGTASGSFTVTATMGGSTHCVIGVLECSALTAIDQHSNAVSANPATSITVTNGSANTNANDFIVAAMAMNYDAVSPVPSYPPSSGYTGFFNDTGWGVNYVDTNAGYKSVSATETSSASWTKSGAGSDDFVAVLASFKQGGQSVTATPTQGSALFASVAGNLGLRLTPNVA